MCAATAPARADCPAPSDLSGLPGWCRGDCDGDRAVDVGELIGLVRRTLGFPAATSCAAADSDGSGDFTIDEVIGAVGSALHGCPSAASLVLRNAKVFTADPERPTAEFVAICGERIVAVGAADDARGVADAATEVIDLQGRTVIPGINDAHVHVLPFDPSPGFMVGLDPTLAEATAALAELVAETQPGVPLFGTVGPTVLDDAEATRFHLDAVAPDNPVALESFTGHGMLFNTAAMQLLGIGETEPDPIGGSFGRDPSTGVLTGIAQEYAQYLVEQRFIALQRDATAVASYRFADLVFAAQGITSVQAMEEQPTLRNARLLRDANPRVRWRLIRLPMPSDAEWPLNDVAGLEAFAHPRITVSGLKYFLDGTPIEWGAATRVPYADRPGSIGLLNVSQAEIEAMLRRALETDQQPMFHAVGDRALETLFDAMDAVADNATWQRVRPRVEHGDLLMPDLIERARDLGVVIVQNPGHFLLGDVFGARFAPAVQAHLDPLRALLDAGVPLALGTDGAASVMLDIALAVAHPANPAQGLTLDEAIAAHTSGGAYAEHAETEKGRLCPGMLADIAVLSKDILTEPLESIDGTVSVLTLVGGEVVFRAPGL